jgi:hypothetical protein
VAWEACRQLYNAESDIDALEAAIRAGDMACVNVYLNHFETILLLGKPDDVLREGDRLLLRYGNQYAELMPREERREESTLRRSFLRIITTQEKRVEL